MDRLEKVERLRERANVSYEEAKAALEMSGDDLLEAMVLLEKQGKVKEPGQSSYSTRYEEQKEYDRVADKVEEQKKAAPTFKKSVKNVVRTIIDFVKHTSFNVTRKEKTLFTMPSWVFALILLCVWKGLVPIMLVALFFGVRYSFDGDADKTEAANDILNKAGSFADGFQNELHKEKETEKKDSEGRDNTIKDTVKDTVKDTAEAVKDSVDAILDASGIRKE